MLLAAWMMFGVFLDGWAHNNVIEDIESFFTPWHGVFFSGFAATAVWMGYVVMRRQKARAGIDLSLIPVGYGTGVVGLILFAAGGVGDMIWHTIFGIEEGTEALLSPTHLLLFVGAALILTSPLRATWHAQSPAEPTLREFAPVLASIVLATAGVAFFFMYLVPFTQWFPTAGFDTWASARHFDVVEMGFELGIASHLWTSLLLVAPLQVASRRWRLPFGSATILFSTVAVGLSAVEAFDGGEKVVAALVGGLAADVILRVLRPRDAVWRFRATAGLLTLPLWVAEFAVIELVWDLGWVVEFWAGTACLASLVCFALACVMTPAPVPSQQEDVEGQHPAGISAGRASL